MSDDLVRFNVRYEKSLFQMKIEAPSDVNGFTEKLKNELHLEDDTNEIVILCPTPDGKMQIIKTDDDIETLKETKLCYNAISKEIYCSVELVAIVIHVPLQDDPKTQIMSLTKKVDQLSSKFDEYLLCFDNKLKENASNILESIRSITLSEQSENSGNTSKKNSIGEQNKPHATVGNGHTKPPKKVKKDKEKVPISSDDTPVTIDHIPDSISNNNQQNIPEHSSNTTTKPKDIDSLLKMLVDEGFNNTIQNIIVLKRFNNDFEKAVNYLKSSSA